MGLKKRYKKKPIKPNEIVPALYPSAIAKNSDNNITIVGPTKLTNTPAKPTENSSEKSVSKTSEQLTLIQSPTATSSLSDGLARTIRLLENAKDNQGIHEAAYCLKRCESLGLKSPTISLLKTSPDYSASIKVATSTKLLECLPKLGMIVNGRFLIQGGFSPRIESGFTLSDILEDSPDPKYFLSEKSLKRFDKREMGQIITQDVSQRKINLGKPNGTGEQPSSKSDK